MNNIEIIMAKTLIKLLNLITIGLKAKDKKITYISYTSYDLPINMKLISDSINMLDTEFEQVYLTMKYTNTLLDKCRYIVEIIKQIYHIKTSKTVIIDGNNFVISNIDKKDTTVIQIWHACGAIKKFGEDFKRKYRIKNYDYIITSSTKSKSIMSSAFGVKKEQVIPLGYSSTDILFKDKIMDIYREKMYKKYPMLKNKKVILYAPTFRGDAVYEKKILDIDLEKIMKIIGEEYILLYKYHPIIQKYKIYNEDNIYDVSNESLYELFSISDILISDFSSIIYEFSILEKPIILYTPDLNEYKKERGLYVNYEEFVPGKIVYNEHELSKVIIEGKFDIKEIQKFKNEYFDYLDGKSSERIARFIENINKGKTYEVDFKDNKKIS